MSLEINTAIYNSKGVDLSAVSSVASQILNNAKAQAQPQVQVIDYSKFNRATLGIDLYSSRTNAELQKQISLTQAGLYTQSVDVAKLNSQAALNLYSAETVAKNVALTQSVQQTELTPVKQIEEPKNIVELFNITDKNSNSHNGFNPFNTDEETADKKQ